MLMICSLSTKALGDCRRAASRGFLPRYQPRLGRYSQAATDEVSRRGPIWKCRRADSWISIIFEGSGVCTWMLAAFASMRELATVKPPVSETSEWEGISKNFGILLQGLCGSWVYPQGWGGRSRAWRGKWHDDGSTMPCMARSKRRPTSPVQLQFHPMECPPRIICCPAVH